MPLDQSLVGREFPPTPALEVTEESVRAFAAAIGAEPGPTAPPTYPIVLAFDAMNAFLESMHIDLFRIVHGEQRFAYERPVRVGDRLTATLTVTSLRQLGEADVLGTSSAILDEAGELVCTGKATLVHTNASTSQDAEERS